MLTIRRCEGCGKYLGLRLDPKNFWEWFKETLGLCPECKAKISQQVNDWGMLMARFTTKK